MSKQLNVKEATKCSVISLSDLRHLETKQLHCSENQLTGFYISAGFKPSSKVISERTLI